jgi:hypothetical protein
MANTCNSSKNKRPFGKTNTYITTSIRTGRKKATP